jgi:hypothetical protein
LKTKSEEKEDKETKVNPEKTKSNIEIKDETSQLNEASIGRNKNQVFAKKKNSSRNREISISKKSSQLGGQITDNILNSDNSPNVYQVDHYLINGIHKIIEINDYGNH